MSDDTGAPDPGSALIDPSTLIDSATEFGARAARHLVEDPVVWLTTVGSTGAPAPNPVWFLWDGGVVVDTFNLPGSARARHLQVNPHVSLNFAGNGQGGDIVVLAGVATLLPDAARADTIPAYLAKYAGHMARLGYDPAGFAAKYSLPIRITLARLRGH